MNFNTFGEFDTMQKWKDFGNWKKSLDFGYLWERNFTEKHSRNSISSIESDTDDFIK